MSEINLPVKCRQVKAICDKHGNLPGELINILHEAQHLQGYLPEEMQRLIAHKLNIPVSQSIWRSHFLYLLYHDTQRKISYLRLYGNCLLCTRLRKIIGRI